MKKTTKKNLLAVLLIVASAALLVVGIFAFFSDRGDAKTDGTAGTVNGVVIVRRADIGDFAVGDVVCFVRGGDAVAHRVIAVTEAGLKTKGDNNPVDDAAIVLPEEIIGKCVIVMNWVAVFLNNLETPTGVLKVIVLPVLFLVTVFLAFKYIKMVRLSKTKEPENGQEKE